MKIVARSIGIFFMFFGFHQTLFSQKNTDGDFIFKQWLFIEHLNQDIRGEGDYPVKDSSLFSLFYDVIQIHTDTLKSNGFPMGYVFLSVSVSKKNILPANKSISYKNYVQKVNVGIPMDYCDGYVLCVNKVSGRSYRVQGFSGNDFLGLLQDVKEQFKSEQSNRDSKQVLSAKYFFKNYSVEGIDFRCIYKGIIAGGYNTKKYPCLISCKDFIISIH